MILPDVVGIISPDPPVSLAPEIVVAIAGRELVPSDPYAAIQVYIHAGTEVIVDHQVGEVYIAHNLYPVGVKPGRGRSGLSRGNDHGSAARQEQKDQVQDENAQRSVDMFCFHSFFVSSTAKTTGLEMMWIIGNRLMWIIDNPLR